ncbi:MAG: short-chain dehydrogenase/reductase, partial [Mycolicibacterium sp.]
GVRVLVVEPSGFATDWAGPSMRVHDLPEMYAETVGVMSALRRSESITAGDPARAAEILVRMTRHNDIPYHLPLGVNAVEGSIRQDEVLLDEDRKWAAVGRSADFAERYPVEFPSDPSC